MREALKPGHSFDDGTVIAVGRTGEHGALGEGVEEGLEGRRDDVPPAPRQDHDSPQPRP
jgi:hypothetical protein